MQVAKGYRVRALVRREDERAQALRELGAEIIQGDLTDLHTMHRVIEGCTRVYARFRSHCSPRVADTTDAQRKLKSAIDATPCAASTEPCHCESFALHVKQ